MRLQGLPLAAIGVSVRDPLTFMAAVTTIVLVTLVGAAIPARRAASIDQSGRYGKTDCDIRLGRVENLRSHGGKRQLGFDAAMTSPRGESPSGAGLFAPRPGRRASFPAAVDQLGREARGVPVAYAGSKATRLVGVEASSFPEG